MKNRANNLQNVVSMPVSTSLDQPDRSDEIDSVIKTLRWSLRKYGRIVNVDMPASKADIMLIQLKRERLRALTAVAKTRALLAEMELLVVQKQLDAFKSNPRFADAKRSPRPSLQRRSKSKTCAKKLKPVSSRSSLHKLDDKSKVIAKTTSSNTPCITCVSNLAKSLNSLQIKKEPSAVTFKYRTKVGLEKEISDLDVKFPKTPENMKQDSKIDVTPSESEVVIVSDDEDSSENKNEDSDTAPISTSPIARKIFGIANYNVAQLENVAHYKNDDSRKPLHGSSRTAAPKANINKMKKLSKTAETSVKTSLPLNSTNKENSINTKKFTAEETRKEKKQSTKDTHPLKVSQSKNIHKENKTQRRSNLSKIRSKLSDSLKVSVPLWKISTDKEKSCKKSLIVDINKTEKDKQQGSQRRDVTEKVEVVKERVIENIVEKRNLIDTQPKIVYPSTNKRNIATLQKEEITRNSITVDGKKEQQKVRKAPPIKLSVSLPLTASNLAKFNRSSQTCQSKNVEKIQAETIKEHRPNKTDKKSTQAPSFLVSIPLNSCTVVPNLQKHPATRDKENLNKPDCGNNEIKESQNNINETKLFAWRSINWGTWGKCNEENSRAMAVNRREYTPEENGPMRKVSWEMFTRRLNISVLSTTEQCPDPPAKKTCLDQRTDEDEMMLTTVADDSTNKELINLHVPKKSAEIDGVQKSTTEAVEAEMANNLEATNTVFKQIMLKKENAHRPEDTRSVNSGQTVLICNMCQCLHETEVCPNRKYFKFLGIDNFKTEM